MPLVYGIALATAGNTTTNATPATENNTFSIKPGIRNVGLSGFFSVGKGAALTAISGIAHRLVNWGTASTAGTALTPTPKDIGFQAAKATVLSGATSGTTRTNHLVIGHGAASPGAWQARDPDSLIVAQGGGANSTDALNVSGTASLPFEWSGEIVE